MKKLHFQLTIVKFIVWTSFQECFTLSETKASNSKPLRFKIVYLSNTPLTEETKALLAQFERNLTSNAGLGHNTQLATQFFLPNSTMMDRLQKLNKIVTTEEIGIFILNLKDEVIEKILQGGNKHLSFDIKTRPRDNLQVIYHIYMFCKPFV